MTNYARIIDGLVVNAIVADAEFIESLPNKSEYKVLTRGGIGYTYDIDADVFIAPQPYPSWTLDSNHDWQPSTPKPDGMYSWDESQLKWIEVV